MAIINREFRLTNEPGGRGLRCTEEGLSLAGVPLLRRTASGFVPRGAVEIDGLMKAAFGPQVDTTDLLPGLGAVARALNRSDLAYAMIAALQLRIPELEGDAVTRLAKAEEGFAKYNADQPRDWRGRWTSDGGSGPGPAEIPQLPVFSVGGLSREGLTINLADAGAPGVASDRSGPPPSGNDNRQQDGARSGAEEAFYTLYPIFQTKYDGLSPDDLAKRVTELGDWMGREGKNLTPAERDILSAEYTFLQSRLEKWLNSDETPIAVQGHLLSAAITLHVGAVNGGIVTGVGIPPSMGPIAIIASALEGGPPQGLKPRLPSIEPEIRRDPRTRSAWVGDPGEHNSFVDNNEVGIRWGAGVKDQGDPFEALPPTPDPGWVRLHPKAKTFDWFNPNTGEALSKKTIHTTAEGYAAEPESVYNQIKGYVDKAADYDAPRAHFDLDPARIKSRTVQAGAPVGKTIPQDLEIERAVMYGAGRGVKVAIVRAME